MRSATGSSLLHCFPLKSILILLTLILSGLLIVREAKIPDKPGPPRITNNRITMRLGRAGASENWHQGEQPQRRFLEMNPIGRKYVANTLSQLPLSFEANLGQKDERVKFYSRTRGYSVFLTSDEAVFTLMGKARMGHAALMGGEEEENHTLLPELPSFSEGPTNKSRRTTPAFPHQNIQYSGVDPPRLPTVFRVKLVGANLDGKITGLDPLPGRSNYFIGNNPKKWRTNVPQFAKVKHGDVYSGIDLVYYGTERQLEYDWIIAPGADPHAIRFRVEGGSYKSRKLSIDASGDLVIPTEGGDVRFRKPVVYQEMPTVSSRPSAARDNHNSQFTSHKSIEGRYVLLADSQVGFEVGTYDRTQPLTIDPFVAYAALLGGSDIDIASAVDVDAAGNAYFAGVTYSMDFPVLNPTQTGHDCSFWAVCIYTDAFVTKINSEGTAILYSTYLGGNLDDYGDGITLDHLGNIYVVGSTISADFPTVGPLQPAFGGGVCNTYTQGDPCSDGFVAKLDATGSHLDYSTFLGGSRNDGVAGVAADALGNAVVAGITNSPNFPVTLGAFDTTCGTDSNCNASEIGDGFVSKISPTGSLLVYSTFLGGSGSDAVYGVKLDGDSNAYVTGKSDSDDFPTSTGSFQTTKTGGFDAFITKVNTVGSDLVYSTYVGGAGDDTSWDIAVDSVGDAYLTGETSSSDFHIVNAIRSTKEEGYTDAFVSKLDTSGTSLVYSTYLGGTYDDYGDGVAVDSSGNAFVTGWTGSRDFPLMNPTQLACVSGGLFDCYYGFVSQLNPSGNALVFSTYFGGTGTAVAADTLGNIFVAAYNYNESFLMTVDNFNLVLDNDGTFHGGMFDALVVKYSPGLVPKAGVSQIRVTFPDQNVGTTSDPYPVVLGDLTSAPVTITSIDVVNDDLTTPSSDFRVDNNGCVRTFAVGERCTVYVYFNPAADALATGALDTGAEGRSLSSLIPNPPGPPRLPGQRSRRSGKMRIGASISASSAMTQPGGTHAVSALTSQEEHVPLRGDAVTVFDSVDRTSLVFEPQLVGTTSQGQSVTLTNITNDLALSVVAATVSEGFSQSSTCGNAFPISIPASGHCIFQVTFTPTAAGSHTGTLTIVTNGVESPHVITLAGTGADFAVSIPPYEGSKTVSAGQTATYNLQLAATGFSGTVALACSWPEEKPTGANCSVPGSVTINGNDPAPFVVSVTTTARAVAAPRFDRRPGRGGDVPPLVGLMLLMLVVTPPFRVAFAGLKTGATRLALAETLLFVLLWAACGGGGNNGGRGSNGTQPGTYHLTLSATASGVSESSTLTLIVN